MGPGDISIARADSESESDRSEHRDIELGKTYNLRSPIKLTHMKLIGGRQERAATINVKPMSKVMEEDVVTPPTPPNIR